MIHTDTPNDRQQLHDIAGDDYRTIATETAFDLMPTKVGTVDMQACDAYDCQHAFRKPLVDQQNGGQTIHSSQVVYSYDSSECYNFGHPVGSNRNNACESFSDDTHASLLSRRVVNNAK